MHKRCLLRTVPHFLHLMMQQKAFLQGGVAESFSHKASIKKGFPSPLLCLMSPPMAGIELEAFGWALLTAIRADGLFMLSLKAEHLQFQELSKRGIFLLVLDQTQRDFLSMKERDGDLR